jgi:phage terminase large subunit
LPKPRSKYTPPTEPLPEDQLAQQLLRWRQAPALFFEEALGVRLTNQQTEACEVLRDLMVAKRKVSEGKELSEEVNRYWKAAYSEKELGERIGISIHSGKGLGKDFWIAGVTIWLLVTLPAEDFKACATAPTKPQLEDIYSSEVKSLLRKSPAELHKFIDVTSKRISRKDTKGANEDSGGGFVTKRTAVVKGTEEEQGETLQGLHKKYLFVFFDESSGLPDGVFKPLQETLTGYCNIAIMIGNVTRNTGLFYRSHYGEKERRRWVCLHWDGEESDLDEVTGLKSHSAYVGRQREDYGENSNVYRITVKGLPPMVEEDALLPVDWIYAARDRWDEIEVDPTVDPVVMGVDVGRGGDDSAICVKVGNKVTQLYTKSTPDTSVLADWLDVLIEANEPDAVMVDSAGMGGTFCDLFRKFYKHEISEVNVSEGASRNEQFYRLRDELWMELREDFRLGKIAIPADEGLLFELMSLKVENNWEQPIKIISKKKLKAQGLKSPNKADAIMHTKFLRGATTERMRSVMDAYREAQAQHEESSNSWMRA